MANCRYKFGSKQFDSYTELLNYIDKLAEKGKLNVDNISDVVYSKGTKLDLQVEKLSKLKADYKLEIEPDFNISSVINGEPNNTNSILNFIDKPICAINGRPLVEPLVVDDYIKNVKAEFVKDGMSEEEADKLIKDTIDHWEIIQKDALSLHEMFTDNTVFKQDADFIAKFENKIPDTIKDTTLLIKLHDQLKKRFFIERKQFPDCKIISNINFSSKLKNESQELLGHIDRMIITKDGTLHLYLYKTTSTPVRSWSFVKVKKYKYQLAFLKQMLANNGIDVRNINMKIIPVELKYNDDYTKVTDITVHNAVPYSTSSKGNAYSMDSYDKDVRYFIENKVEPEPVSNNILNNADDINKAIFPDLNIKQEGIAISAKLWIMKAPTEDPEGTELLVIKEVNDKDHYYDVIINGRIYPIKTKGNKYTNPEIEKVIKDHISELSDNLGYSVLQIKEAIDESYSKGYIVFGSKRNLMGKSSNLSSVFSKYLTPNRDKEGNITGYDWEMLDNLIDSNVLIFRHKETNAIDIISLSPFDLNAKVHFKKGDTILGSYLRKSDYIDLESNYGNIELVKTMTLLNEVLPKLGDVKLGNIGVLSSVGQFSYVSKNIGEFNKRHYRKIIDVVKLQNKDLDFDDNFKNAQFISELDNLVREYLNIVSTKDNSEKAEYEQYGFGDLEVIQTKEKYAKIDALRNILQLLLLYNFNDMEFFDSIKKEKSREGNLARLYELTANAYFSLTGEEIVRNTSYNNIEHTFSAANVISNENNQFIVNGLQTTYDAIASEFGNIYDKEMKSIFTEYYDEVGYTAALNMSIGNQASVYNNLYELDTMTFKNPYDMSNDLTQPERKLLKKVLYQIAKITHKGEFRIQPNDETAIIKYIEKNPDYLWVPLERASKGTSRTGVKRVLARFKNGFKRLRKIQDRVDEYVNGITKEERDLLGNNSDEFYTFSLKNPFQLSKLMGGDYNEIKKKRGLMIKEYTPAYFETNLENLLIDYLVKSIQTEQLNKFIAVAKAFLFKMKITGNMNGNKSVVEKEIKHIENYLKLNVYNDSIMSSQEQSVMSWIMPVKKFVTDLLIGGNMKGFVRDIFQGLQSNFLRSYSKLNTDIDAASVSKAYAYVTSHATSNAMAINLLGKLCIKYRLSNTDIGRIGERAKTGRNGLINYDNWLYGTMRSPDFINRMTLFVAKCMHDGSWDAYSIDETTNNLVYDWTKDKRFSVYASGNKNHPDYLKQKSLYLSKVKIYNEEHPDKPIHPSEGLPTPYSLREIQAIRNVGDNIYGGYDKSKKSLSEFHALGIVFTMFTTWLNGINANYFMKPLKNGVSYLLEEQEVDENGNPLFYDDDGNITTEDTGAKVLKYVPPIVMGIFPSLGVLFSIYRDKGKQFTLDYINGNPIMKANLRKLLADLLQMILMGSLFTYWLNPAYNDYKKKAKSEPLLKNLTYELLYYGGESSYDISKGPINIIELVGKNSSTPIYSVPSQLFHNGWDFISGDKDLGTIFTTNTGLGRSFKDTYKIYHKKSDN